MARPIARGVLSFGLVAIPVAIHTAVCNEVVERDQLVRGYEDAKEEYVHFTDAELETIEAEANNNIELKEFIPIEKVDPFYFEGAHYLAPDEGGDKAYRLARRRSC